MCHKPLALERVVLRPEAVTSPGRLLERQRFRQALATWKQNQPFQQKHSGITEHVPS